MFNQEYSKCSKTYLDKALRQYFGNYTQAPHHAIHPQYTLTSELYQTSQQREISLIWMCLARSLLHNCSV